MKSSLSEDGVAVVCGDAGKTAAVDAKMMFVLLTESVDLVEGTLEMESVGPKKKTYEKAFVELRNSALELELRNGVHETESLGLRKAERLDVARFDHRHSPILS